MSSQVLLEYPQEIMKSQSGRSDDSNSVDSAFCDQPGSLANKGEGSNDCSFLTTPSSSQPSPNSGNTSQLVEITQQFTELNLSNYTCDFSSENKGSSQLFPATITRDLPRDYIDFMLPSLNDVAGLPDPFNDSYFPPQKHQLPYAPMHHNNGSHEQSSFLESSKVFGKHSHPVPRQQSLWPSAYDRPEEPIAFAPPDMHHFKRPITGGQNRFRDPKAMSNALFHRSHGQRQMMPPTSNGNQMNMGHNDDYCDKQQGFPNHFGRKPSTVPHTSQRTYFPNARDIHQPNSHFPNDMKYNQGYPDASFSQNAPYSTFDSLKPALEGPLMELLNMNFPKSNNRDEMTEKSMYQFPNVSRGSPEEKFSRKVFVGGLPPDIDEEEITSAFRRFGSLLVDWPHKAESKSFFPPKGYCFLLFQNELSVQHLIESCILDDGKYYWCVSSPTLRDKMVQIRPWCLYDSDYVMDDTHPLDPRRTIFVGGVPRPLRAMELAGIMNQLYGGVCYAGIDTDPELKYPKGAGRVAFSNQQSYIAAISARFVQLQHNDIDKRVEVKPYVLDDQVCDECAGARSGGKYAPFFCANVTCLQYYCEQCWAMIHASQGREYHKPLVKEGSERPRMIPFRW